MVIPSNTPALSVRKIFIGTPVCIGVAQPRQFAALHGIEIPFVQRETERLVKAACEPFVYWLASRKILSNPHLAFSYGNRHTIPS